MGKAERVAIFVDGGNFFRRLRDPQSGLQKGTRFDYARFAATLAGGRHVIARKYYIGSVRNHDGSDKSERLVRSQQKFLSEIEREGFEIERGRIVYDHAIREKGVDVKIAIDMVVGAAENQYDTAIVVSSDTDLIPAVKYLQSKGMKVEYVGFSHQPSIGMIKESDLSLLLTAKEIQAHTK